MASIEVAAQQSLSVLKKQMALAKARQDAVRFGPTAGNTTAIEAEAIPSENQHFFYVADNQGVIRIQSDAAFVAERIFMYPQWASTTDTRATSSLSRAAVILFEDVYSGRQLSDGVVPSPDTTETAQRSMIPSQSIPVATLVPGGSLVSSVYNQSQWDYWFALPADFLLPRSGVLRCTIQTPGNFGGDIAYVNCGIVLSGYKVYG